MHVVVRRRRAETGATLVEFALILPVLMALILGMFSGGISYNRKISMTNAVREGSRYGATLLDDTSQTTDWYTPVRDRVVDLSSGDITASQVCVQLVKMTSANAFGVVEQSPSCTPGPAGAPAIPGGAVANQCLVRVWAARDSTLEAMFFKTTLKLKAAATSRYERGC
jgi:Flp pilus assembly protein TadG